MLVDISGIPMWTKVRCACMVAAGFCSLQALPMFGWPFRPACAAYALAFRCPLNFLMLPPLCNPLLCACFHAPT